MDDKRRKEIERPKNWQELPLGGCIQDAGNSTQYITGEWAPTKKLKWKTDKCKQCLLCWPVCPDQAILAKDGKMTGIDIEHCKNCGMCVTACPFDALEMEEIHVSDDKFAENK